MLSEVLPYLNVETSTDEDAVSAENIPVADYTGLGVAGAETSIENATLKYKVFGNGEVVISQFPREGTKLREGGLVVLYTDESAKEHTVTVPDVIGRTPSAANTLLVNSSLNIKMEGAYRDDTTGTVATGQSPKAGEQVSPGTLVSVDFHHMDNSD